PLSRKVPSPHLSGEARAGQDDDVVEAHALLRFESIPAFLKPSQRAEDIVRGKYFDLERLMFDQCVALGFFVKAGKAFSGSGRKAGKEPGKKAREKNTIKRAGASDRHNRSSQSLNLAKIE